MERVLKSLKSEDEHRPSKLQHCWDRVNTKTCCQSNLNERLLGDSVVKKNAIIIMMMMMMMWKKMINTSILLRNWKKLWNMKMTFIPTIIALGTVTKGFIKGLEDLKIKGREESIRTTALLRSVTIMRRVLKTCGDFLPFRFQWKTIS